MAVLSMRNPFRKPTPRKKSWGKWAMRSGILLGVALLVVGWLFYGAIIGQKVNDILAQAIGAQVERIMVEGVTYTDRMELQDSLGLKKGDDLVAFNTKQARTRLESLPWVKVATVERRLPDTVKVDIYEYQPLARLMDAEGDQEWLITKNGDRIEESSDVFAALPKISGAGAADHAAQLFALMQDKPNFLAQLKEAVRIGERRWDIHFKSGVLVQLPAEKALNALQTLEELDQKRHVLTLTSGEIDLRLPDRITLRLPEDTASDVVLESGKEEG